MHRNILLLALALVAIIFTVGCESEYNPGNVVGPQDIEIPDPVHDTTTIIIYDSTSTNDTVVIVIDSTETPCDTCTCDTTVTDSTVYADCVTLGKGTRIGTLGEPGYFVTVSREKTNGHPIEFCLYVYRTEGGDTGVLSATHLKKDWPVVRVEVSINDSQPIFWDVGDKHQTKDLVF